MREGWAVSGLEAGGHWRQGGGEAGCGGSTKPGGDWEEVGSVRGAMGKSHCQLGLGEQGEGALILFFPRSSLVLQQKQTPLSVSCKKSFRFGGPSGVIFPNPS